MKKKSRVITCIALIGAVSFFIIAGFTPNAPVQNEKSTCCSQKMNGCEGNINGATPGDMMLDNISRQFLSISTLVY
jgi:hypothetical protein